MSFAGTAHKQRTARPVSNGSTKSRKPKARRKPSWDVCQLISMTIYDLFLNLFNLSYDSF